MSDSEKYNELCRQLKAASKRLEEVMKEKKTDIIRDSAIQRFEFTYELVWKMLKADLQFRGIKDLYSPKDIFKAAFQNRIIDNDPKWLDMVDTRNETSHLYKESMADEVYKKLPIYLQLIKNLIKEIS